MKDMDSTSMGLTCEIEYQLYPIWIDLRTNDGGMSRHDFTNKKHSPKYYNQLRLQTHQPTHITTNPPSNPNMIFCVFSWEFDQGEKGDHDAPSGVLGRATGASSR